MSVATVAVGSEPDRHALVLLDCDCGTCPPAWARRRGKSRRFTEPVTLVAALERENAAAWRAMVDQHRESLEELTGAADRLIAVTTRDDPARPGAGLSLLMFAAELASAVRPDEYRGDLPAGLVAARAGGYRGGAGRRGVPERIRGDGAGTGCADRVAASASGARRVRCPRQPGTAAHASRKAVMTLTPHLRAAPA
jgi:hypothetical protein